jgi:subtilisin-like proprotein convertase family protein
MFANHVHAQDTWTMVATGGIDSYYNSTIYGMNVFNGQLYAAAGADNGAVYRSPTGNPNSWSRVFSDPNSFSVEAINSTTAGGGNLYIASANNWPDTSRVYRSTDGSSWVPYFTTSSTIRFIAPFKGTGTVDSIYLAEDGYVFKSYYNSNDPLNLSGAWDTVFDISVQSPGAVISTMSAQNGKLYIGTTGAQLFSSADGNNWTLNPTVNGFGDPTNKIVTAVGYYGGELFVAMGNSIFGAQLWKSPNESSWSMVHAFSSDYPRINSLQVADSKLWLTVETSNSYGGLIWNTSDGVTFHVSNSNGFGDPGHDGTSSSVTGFGNNVYWGGNYSGGMAKFRAAGSGGAEIWRTCTVAPPLVNIGADQTVCQGTSATFDAGPGSAYLWSTGDTTRAIAASAPGVYSVELVGINGCSGNDQAILFNNPAPAVTSPNLPPMVCNGTSVNIISTVVSNGFVADPPIHTTSNAPIGDMINGGEAADTISVSGLSTSCSCDALLSVTIDSLYHTYSADLDIGIYSPSGSYITLSQSNGGSQSDSYNGTEFNMTATTSITAASPPFNSSYQPMGDFDSLLGDPNGNWILRVQDHVGGDNGVLKGWTIRFKVDDTVMTYSWAPPAGLSSVNTINTIATPAATTTYTMTATNSFGCSTQTPYQVNVADLVFAQAADTVCYGGSLVLDAQGATANATWFPTTGLSDSTGNFITASPSSSIEYYVRDTIAGCAVLDSIYIYANPQLFLIAPAPVSICQNDTATFTANASGGSAPYAYAWDMGGVYLYGQTIQPVLSGGTSYTLTATDLAGCMINGGSTSAFVTPSTDIYGHASYSGGSVNNSAVVLYRVVPFLTQFDTVQITTTDASGDYHFVAVDHNDYLIEVYPDPSYTTIVPTYYGNVYLWDSALMVDHGCAVADTFNIAAVETTGLTGPGFLQGTILEDIGFGRVPGDPVPGVDVKLGRNPGAQLVANTQTNAGGTYTFAGVPYGDYIIYADIPGLGRDSSYNITVDAAHDTYTDLDYLVNDTTIFIVPNTTTGISTPAGNAAVANTFSVYPNPSSGNAGIEYSIRDDATVSLGIYNVLGVKVIDLVDAKQTAGVYHCSISREKNSLKPGVYYVTLITNGKQDIHRLVISE